MLSKITKSILTFFAICFFFILTAGSIVVLRFHWNDNPPNGKEVEVNLPVINWDSYLQLSKKLE